MNIEAKLTAHLLRSGVHPIWVNGALNHMRFSTNSWFATKGTLQNFKKDGDRIKRISMHLEVEFPDRGTKGCMSVVYTFDPKRKGAMHRCEYKEVTPSTFIVE